MIAIVAYDIPSDRRRTRVARLLSDFGTRIQYSVFECDLTPARLTALRSRLLDLTNSKKDRIHVYPVCQSCFDRAWSIGPAYEGEPGQW